LERHFHDFNLELKKRKISKHGIKPKINADTFFHPWERKALDNSGKGEY
jgi:hypothetical protein